jgi:hypothetical protein
MSNRVEESRRNLSALDFDLINRLCTALLAELGEGETFLEQQAFQYLIKGDYDAAKQYCLKQPTNTFLAAISCISSAYRSPMVADSVLRDAARHTAEVAKQKAEARINQAFSQILNTEAIESQQH